MNARELLEIGDRFNPAAVLLVDGNQILFAPDDGQVIVKPITLASGTHQIRIVNPGNVSLATHVFTLD